mmetsp:Transcript_59696/g.141241  ORF Transcript_59696/g.141241 Transcript_59696/m.141241 type:complete len:207 (-) Transcript_59696:1051-1671(-)
MRTAPADELVRFRPEVLGVARWESRDTSTSPASEYTRVSDDDDTDDPAGSLSRVSTPPSLRTRCVVSPLRQRATRCAAMADPVTSRYTSADSGTRTLAAVTGSSSSMAGRPSASCQPCPARLRYPVSSRVTTTSRSSSAVGTTSGLHCLVAWRRSSRSERAPWGSDAPDVVRSNGASVCRLAAPAARRRAVAMAERRRCQTTRPAP